jgi:signal peptidase II
VQLGQSIPVIGDFLRLTFVENPGMIFGIEIGGPLLRVLFTLIVSFGILYYIYHVRQEPMIVRLTLAMILGGAIGNLIDRIFYGVIFGEASLFHGRVVDFIDMDFFHIDFFGIHTERFAVFNVADACVSTGLVLMLIFHHKFSKVGAPAAETQKPSDQSPVTNEVNTQKDDAKSSSVDLS